MYLKLPDLVPSQGSLSSTCSFPVWSREDPGKTGNEGKGQRKDPKKGTSPPNR